MPGVIQSRHPLYRVAALGPLATQLTSGHERAACSVGVGTPFEFMALHETQILGIGKSMQVLTQAHHVEHAMGDAYPELRRDKARVAQVLAQEEERFGETLEHGMRILEQAIANAPSRADGARALDGETAFTLYDTFGFPLDLTADICRERKIAVDAEGFDAAMEKQRERARAEQVAAGCRMGRR